MQDTNSPMFDTALRYKALGFSVLGCRDKKPVMGSWLAYKSEIASLQDLEIMFVDRKAEQIAIICGSVSGNLEIIDVDLKHDKSGNLFDRLWAAIVDYFKGQPPQFLLQSTPSGGFHIVYRCEGKVKGNLKLASREELKPGKTKPEKLAMIETRGEAGYFIATPSPKYTSMMGSIEALPVLSEETVADLHDICRQFNQVLTKHRDKPKSKVLYSFKMTPWDHYNSDENLPSLELLLKHGWQVTKEEEDKAFLRRPGAQHDNHWGAIFHKDTHIFYVFTSSSDFDPEKGYSPTAVLAYLEHDGDFAAACAALRRDGFGTTFSETEKRAMERAGNLYGEGLSHDDIVRMLMGEFPEVKEGLDTVVTTAEKKARVRKGIFWRRTNRGDLRIEKPKLADFLGLQGYRLLGQTVADREKQLVHIDPENHIIKEMPLNRLKLALQQWLYDTDFTEFEVTDAEVRALLFDLTRAAWNDIFDWLEVLTIDSCPILRDTRYTTYIPFRNCIVKITKKEIIPIQYDDLPNGLLIWDTAIKDRDIFLAPVREDTDLNNSSAFLFIKRIAGVTASIDHLGIAELASMYPKTWLSLQSFLTVTGYLCTNYKDPENPKSVILAEDTDDEGKGGGTGKGLYMQFISHVRNVCKLFGRHWKPEGDFIYQRVRPSDDILFIDDTPMKFNFMELYNVITEGIAVNRKHKDEIFIPYTQSPKVVISTNYDVEADGEHGHRRRVKLYFQKYFSSNHKPAKEFGKAFFSEEWSDEDWNWFYNVMFFMVQAYYTWGLVEVDTTENMRIKQIKLRYREEFYDFMHRVIFDADAPKAEFHIVKDFIPFDRFYHEFLDASGLDVKEYSKRRFSYAIKFFSEQFQIEYIDRQITSGAEKGKKEMKCILPDWLTKELLEKAKKENDAHGDLPF